MEWHLWDHLVQDVNPNLSNYGVISEHPELLNINLGQVGFGMSSFGSDNADWIHLILLITILISIKLFYPQE